MLFISYQVPKVRFRFCFCFCFLVVVFFFREIKVRTGYALHDRGKLV